MKLCHLWKSFPTGHKNPLIAYWSILAERDKTESSNFSKRENNKRNNCINLL